MTPLNHSISKTIKVLFVVPQGDGKSNMVFSRRIGAYLKKKLGVEIEIFFLNSRTSLLILLKEWVRFRREIKKFKPQLIDAQYGTMTAFFCAMGTRLPLVITFRGSDLNPNKGVPLIRDLVSKWLSQVSALRASKIICVSKQLKDRLWWRKNDVKIITSGVDTQVFFPASRDEARSRMGWDKDEKVILFNASFKGSQVRKRVDLAQAAVDIAKGSAGEIRYFVLDGFLDPKMMPDVMNASDCLLVTSDSEGSPNVVREALACNLPIVSVDVADVRESLKNIRPSRVVSRDPGEIGQALSEILEKRERSNGAEFIKELSVEKITDNILLNYQEALGIVPS